MRWVFSTRGGGGRKREKKLFEQGILEKEGYLKEVLDVLPQSPFLSINSHDLAVFSLEFWVF